MGTRCQHFADTIDNHLVRNTPGGSESHAYPEEGPARTDFPDVVMATLVELAREAEARYKISPVTRTLPDEDGRFRPFDLMLGLTFTCGLEEIVIPFFDRGLPVEYELTRSIRVVSSAQRRKVGIVDTDLKDQAEAACIQAGLGAFSVLRRMDAARADATHWRPGHGLA